MPLTIDVVSDVVCPWCFIGKRKLERALELYKERNPDADAPVVRWHPFQLNPDLPKEGTPRQEYIARKFGPRGGSTYERVKAVGQTVGIEFAFDRIERQPNTLAAHSLIALAGTYGIQDEVKEAMLRAYFLDARDLTSDDTLRDIAVGAGMPAEEAAAALRDDGIRASVSEADRQARQMGVEGVPFFIFNRRVAVSGAHDPEVLLQAIAQAEQEAANPAANAS
jgi:predicted DsbA family dithiol-disulfide isomerase